MNRDELRDMSLGRLVPFGVEVTAADPAMDLRSMGLNLVKGLVEENRVLIMRGFASLPGDEFPEFCRRFGELQKWDFGVVNNLRVESEAKNYLYTNRAVPFHWDGAFAGQIPHYIVFQCDAAPAHGGGETLFCDTVRVLARAPEKLLKAWHQIEITYTTERVVHYGGTFTAPLVTEHPENGSQVLRFAEPVFDLNPVQLSIKGLSDSSEAEFLADLHERLRDEAVCYAHTWRGGDVVIADNHVLLHGRREFAEGGERHIRRVNVF